MSSHHSGRASVAVIQPVAPAPATSSQAPIIINNNNNAPAPAPTQTVYQPVQVPAGGQFLDVTTLANSLATEQGQALTAAPDEDYYSADSATITTDCYPAGDGVYNCSATDTDGDTGYGDTVTVYDNGNEWSDTGMNWTGPDIYIYGGVTNYWTTPDVSGMTS